MIVGGDSTSVRILPLSVIGLSAGQNTVNILTCPTSVGLVAVLVGLDEHILEEICEPGNVE